MNPFSALLVQAQVQAAEGVGVRSLLSSLTTDDMRVCIQEVAGSFPVGSTHKALCSNELHKAFLRIESVN